MISKYASNAGKSGGEFFTPTNVSKLISQLALHNQKTVNKIYDPAAGSGSLLLQAKKQFDEHIIEDGFYGQEINHTTYNLARMNMFLHNINYDKFEITLGDTLLNPQFKDEKPFDAIVSNPPYSIKWVGSDDTTLINDERYAPAGVLAKIRQYLVEHNYVETIISLAPNLFYGTSIAVNIIVLSKNKPDSSVQFIDASELFKKETSNNILTDEHIATIIQAFDSKQDVEHFAKSIEKQAIIDNEYNLAVSSYVETKDTREIIDIKKLNAEITEIVTKIDQLRYQIDAIVAEIES